MFELLYKQQVTVCAPDKTQGRTTAEKCDRRMGRVSSQFLHSLTMTKFACLRISTDFSLKFCRCIAMNDVCVEYTMPCVFLIRMLLSQLFQKSQLEF